MPFPTGVNASEDHRMAEYESSHCNDLLAIGKPVKNERKSRAGRSQDTVKPGDCGVTPTLLLKQLIVA